MGKIQYNTDAYNHTNEKVLITVTGEKMISLERHGYALYYTLFGLSNETATISITLPQGPSTLSPIKGRTASEKRCLSRLRTCIIKAKLIASTT